MNKSPYTSKFGTPTHSQEPFRSNHALTPISNDGANPSGSITEVVGRGLTPITTRRGPGAHRATNTNDDCEFEFIMSGDSRHPVGIHCSIHDWFGQVS